MAGRRRGFALIVAASAIVGISGYAIAWLVYRGVGPDDYALFAIFWSALYLVVGGLTGIQQEVTRATRPVERPDGRANRARNFALVLAALVAGTVLASSPLWAIPIFGAPWIVFALAIGVGAGSYVLFSTLAGSLYGIESWRPLALLIAFDGAVRLLLVGVGLVLGVDVVVLACLVVAPIPLAVVVLWPILRRGFVGRTTVDVGYRALSSNVARTILAAASTAVLVSGFPLLLGVASPNVKAAVLGELIFAITIVRAPLIVGIMAFQSFLIVVFRDGEHWLRRLVLLEAALLGVGAIGALLGALVGPAVLELVGGHPSTLSGGFVALLVASSALVGGLALAASAVLARSRHSLYSAGWVLAAIVTIVALLLPLPLIDRVSIALIAGPVAGIVTDALGLAIFRRRRSEPAPAVTEG